MAMQFEGARLLGSIPLLFGVLIYSWCAWDFTFAGRGTPNPADPPQELVVRGLYKFTRNPMYVGIILVLLGETTLFASPTLLLYTAAIFAVFHLWVIYYEEPALRRKFGQAYERYCRRVSRWIPRLVGHADAPE